MYYNICNLQMEKSFFIAVEAGNCDIHTGGCKSNIYAWKTGCCGIQSWSFYSSFYVFKNNLQNGGF